MGYIPGLHIFFGDSLVTLLLAFCPNILGRGGDLQMVLCLLIQVQWWRYHEVVGTFKPYLMQNNLFDVFALTDSKVKKTSGASAHVRATCWIFHYLMLCSQLLFISDQDIFHKNQIMRSTPILQKSEYNVNEKIPHVYKIVQELPVMVEIVLE